MAISAHIFDIIKNLPLGREEIHLIRMKRDNTASLFRLINYIKTIGKNINLAVESIFGISPTNSKTEINRGKTLIL